MKHSLPLVLALAASLATPAFAQDINDMMNPRAMIAELGLGDLLNGAAANRIVAPRVIQIAPAELAALQLDTTVLSSPRPVLRPRTLAIPELARVPEAAPAATDMGALLEAMDIAAVEAPAGANTLVASGVNTAVVNGTNTAVIHSDGAELANAAAPRLSLWQRIFGQ